MSDVGCYIVVDVETDGPVPGQNSMLALGAVACDADGRETGSFVRTLQPAPGATPDIGTMAWWSTEPEAWAAVTADAASPHAVITAFVEWVEAMPKPVVFVAHPIAFDGIWMDWYLRRFAGLHLLAPPRAARRLFEGSGLDLPSLARGVLGLGLVACTRKEYPPELYGDMPHSHEPLDDARGYARLLQRLLQRARGVGIAASV